MTHIEQMIKDMCPNGVEFKKLGEVTYWDKRFNEVERSMQPQIRKYHYYLASELEDLESPTGTIKILYTSNKIAYAEEETVAENVVDAEVVAIPWGGNANIKYFKGKFVTADNRIAVVRDTSILSTKFVYYWLKQNQEEIDSYYRGAGIKHPSMLKVLSFEIPIPPMEVQKHIVTVLDAYSALAAELQAELQMRRKQYEYYRTRLLTPHSDCNSATKPDDCNWEWKTFAELGVFYGGLSGKSKEDFKDGNAKFITYLNIGCNPALRLDISETVKIGPNERQNIVQYGDALFTGSSETPDECAMSSVVTEQPAENLYLNSFCFGFRFNSLDGICPAFYKHYFRSDAFRKAVRRTANGTTRFNVSKKEFAKLSIPIPPLAEQERIVSILDKFEALTTSLSDGIPAEQAAQQKRYEYYRDKLLTFEKRP